MAAGSKRFVLLLLMLHYMGYPHSQHIFLDGPDVHWRACERFMPFERRHSLLRINRVASLNPVQFGTRFYREYSDDSIERLALIALGKRLYFPLSVMVEPLNRLMSNDLSQKERIEFVKSGVERIDRKIEELKSAKRKIMRIIANPERYCVDNKIKERGLWMD